MKRIIILNVFTAIFVLCSIAVSAKTSEGKSTCRLNRDDIHIKVSDTIPVTMKPAEVTGTKPVTEKPVISVIKTVPKARRVTVPKPVTVKVKPVKIIKPKIIKPVLKVL